MIRKVLTGWWLAFAVFFIGCDIQKVSDPATGTIRGTITVDEAIGIESIRIEIVGTRLRIGIEGDGPFVIENVPIGERVLVISGTEYREERREVTVTANAISDIGSFTIHHNRGMVTGQARLGDTTDRSGIIVSVQGTSLQVEADENGSYTVSNVPAGDRIIEISKEYYVVQEEAIVVVHEEITEIDFFTLVRERSEVTGLVNLEDASAHGNIRVEVLGTRFSALTGKDGGFVLRSIPAGDRVLRIYLPESKYDEQQKSVDLTGGYIDIGTVILTAGKGSISGTVTLENSLDRANIRVEVEGMPSLNVQTGADGIYTLTDIPIGPQTFVISKSGYHEEKITTGVNTGVTTYVRHLILRSSEGKITGIVTLDDGVDHSGISVSVEGMSGLNATTDLNGSFTIVQVPAGTHNVKAMKAGYSPRIAEIILVQGGTVGVSLSLSPERSMITGKVTLEGETDHAGIKISVQTTPLFNLTDRNGNFNIDRISAGTHSLEITKAGYDTKIQTVTTVDSETTMVTNIELIREKGSIEGTISLDDRGIASGITVEAKMGANTLTATTGMGGRYTIGNVPTGEWTVRATKLDYDHNMAMATVNKGSATVIDLGLARQKGDIEGKVTLDDREASTGIMVKVKDGATDISAVTIISRFGNYNIENIPTGSYTVEASKDDYSTESENITISAGNTTDVTDIVLVRDTGSITGRVMLSDRATPSGVEVSVDGFPTLMATTDGAGDYTIVAVPTGSQTIIASIMGYGDQNKVVPVMKDEEADAGTITLNRETGSIAGTVMLSDRETPSGVEISVVGFATLTAMTGSDGTFTIGNVPTGAQTIVISKADYGNVRRIVNILKDTEASPGAITLVRGAGSIQGMITLDDGTTPSGILVAIRASFLSINTDPTGSFTIGSVPAGEQVIEVSKSGYTTQTRRLTVTIGTPTRVTDIELIREKGSIEGTISLDDGAIASGITVEAKMGATTLTATTGPAGMYTIGNVPTGEWTVRATKSAYDPKMAMATVNKGSATVIDLDLARQKGGIQGRVTLDDGEASTGIMVKVKDGATEISAVTIIRALGNYNIEDIPTGSYTVEASKDDYSTESEDIIISAGNTTDVTDIVLVRDTGSITGRVMLSDRATPSGVKVSVDGFPGLMATTDGAGDYTIVDVPTGSQTIIASIMGYGDQNKGVPVMKDEEADAGTITLNRETGSIAGAVILSDRATPSGVEVSVVGFPTLTAMTDSGGTFTIGNVPTGAQTIVVSKANYGNVERIVNIEKGTPASPGTITLVRGAGSIQGTITVDDTTAPSGILVAIPGQSLSDTTDITGNFAIGNVPAGDQMIQVSKSGYTTQTRRLTVTIGTPTRVTDIELIREKGSIEGTISLDDGAIASGITVEAKMGATTLTATTGPAGMYTIGNVPTGEWTVRATKSAYDPKMATATVNKGSATAIDLGLARQKGGIQGRVTLDDGEASIGIMVKVKDGATEISTVTIIRAFGNYNIEDIPTGSYTVEASKDDYSTVSEDITISAGSTTDVTDIVLVRDTGSITGRVMLSDRATPSGVKVSVDGFPGLMATTDGAGDYTIVDVPTGSQTITASIMGYGDQNKVVPVMKDTPADAGTITLNRETGSIGGTVMLSDGATPSGVEISVVGFATLTAMTDSGGTFTIGNVPTGAQTIVVSKANYGNVERMVTIVKDTPASPGTITLVRGAGSIQGTITVDDATAPSGILVAIPGQSLSDTTDMTGNFAIGNVPAGDQMIQVSKSGYTTQTRRLTVTIGTPTRVTDIELIREKGSIEGTISLDDGAIASGITVEAKMGATTLTATTGPAGMYTIGNVPTGEWTVRATKSAYDHNMATATVNKGSATAIDLGLARQKGGIQGRVTLDDGEASTGIMVKVKAGATEISTVTIINEFGNYNIADIPTGSYTVEASKDDYSTVSEDIIISAGNTTNVTEIVLVRDTGSITGTVMLSDGATPSGVEVSVVGFPDLMDTTDGAGDYTIVAVPTGSQTIIARITGYGDQNKGVPVVKDEEADAGTITLNRETGSIGGTVMLSDGATPSGVEVSVVGFPTLTAMTDSGGTFTIGNVPTGSQTIVVSKANYGNVERMVTIVKDTEASPGAITLVRGAGSIQGVITVDDATAPSGILVTIPGQSLSAITDMTGNFTIGNVPAGEQMIEVSKSGYTTQTRRLTVTIGTPTRVTDIELIREKGSIEGTISLDDGGMVSGITVEARMGATTLAATISGGIYTIDNVPTGEWTVRATKSDYDPNMDTATVNKGSMIVIDLVLARQKGDIEGKVTLDDGEDSIGIMVKVKDGGRDISTMTIDSRFGNYNIEDIPTGSYTVEASKDDYSTVSEDIIISAGDTTDVTDIVLVRDTGSITGTVRLSDGETPTGVEVSVVGFPGLMDTTDDTGDYTIDNVPTGSRTITARITSYEDQDKVVPVVKDAEANAGTITLDPQTGSISGTVTLGDGATPTGIEISVDGNLVLTTTEESGSFTITDVRIGLRSVTFNKRNYNPFTRQLSVLRDRDSDAGDINLEATLGTIIGRIVTLGTTNIPNTRITITGGSTINVTSAGSFAFSNVLPGRVLVNIITPDGSGYNTPSRSRDIVSGEVTDVGDIFLYKLPVSRRSGRVSQNQWHNFFKRGDILYAPGYRAVYRSTDNGVTWGTDVQTVNTFFTLRDVIAPHQAGGNFLYSVGFGRAIFRADLRFTVGTAADVSPSGNGTFHAIERPHDPSPRDQDLIVVGQSGLIYVSLDGGNFNSRTSGTSQTLYDVAGLPGGGYIVVGGGGTIRSTTGFRANSWQARTSGTTVTLRGVVVANDDRLVVVGDGGTILTSDDAGATWISRPSGITETLDGVTADGNRIVAVGAGGKIIASLDNGATWFEIASGTITRLNGVLITRSTTQIDRIFIGGQNDLILSIDLE